MIRSKLPSTIIAMSSSVFRSRQQSPQRGEIRHLEWIIRARQHPIDPRPSAAIANSPLARKDQAPASVDRESKTTGGC